MTGGDSLPQPVPPVDEQALASIPEPLTACPRCGFLGLRPASYTEGVFAGGGELTKESCPRCGFVGVALSFRTRSDYAAFVKDLNRERPGD